MQCPPEPYVKEVHQVGVGDGVVVRWVRNDKIEICPVPFICRRQTVYGWLWNTLQGGKRMFGSPRYPVYRSSVIPTRLRSRITFAEVPDNGQCESDKRMSKKLTSRSPRHSRAREVC